MSVASSSSRPESAELRRLVARLEARVRQLDAAERRRRIEAALAGPVLRGLVAALVLLVLGHYVRAFYHPVLIVGTVLVSLGIVLAQAAGKRRSALEAAVWVDDRAGLDERVSSAVIFLAEPTLSPMMEQTAVDAEARLKEVRIESVSGPPVSRWWLLVPLLLLALSFLALLPPVPTRAEREAEAARREVAAAGAALAQAGERIQEALDPNATEAAREAVQATMETGRRLESGDVRTREQALQEVEQTQRAVEDALRDDAARRTLGAGMQRDSRTRGAGEALENGDPREAARRLREAARELGSDDVSGARGQQMADTLRETARQLPPGPLQAAANRAAEAAETGDVDGARRAMEAMADEVENLQSLGSEADRAQVQRAAEALRDARAQASGAPIPQGESGQDGDREGESGQPGDGPPAASEEEAAPTGGGGSGLEADIEQRQEPGGGTGLELGDREESELSVNSGARVELVGELLQGERRESDRGRGGPVVEDETGGGTSEGVDTMRRLAEREIARQDIPPADRALVREYFSLLEQVAGGEAPAERK